MFTGLIEATGKVLSMEKSTGGAFLRIESKLETNRGDSVSVNGVCLTLIPCSTESVYEAALSHETLTRTSLDGLEQGAVVNLERALTLGDRLGGHLVQGHVDATGELQQKSLEGSFGVFRWSFPEEMADLIIEKGSIAVDGISLTIIEPDERSFAVAIIPETMQKTNLSTSEPGDRVNLEFDMMAKYARHLFSRYLDR